MNISKPKFFLLIVFLSFILFSILYITYYDSLVKKNDEAVHSYKHFLIEHTIGPRIIIESGSNSYHGINSALLEKEFKMLTINLADNASYPLELKLHRIAKYANPGDIILLPLEFSHYGYTYAPKIFYDNIFDKLNFYYNSLSILDILKLISNTPFSSIFEATLKKNDPNIKNNISLLVMNNYINNFYSKKRGDSPSIVQKKVNCNEKCRKKNIPSEFSTVFKQNIDLIKKIESDKNIKFIFTWPSFIESTKYHGQCDDKFSTFVNKLKNFMQINNIPLIGDPQDGIFSEEFMKNTCLHIMPKARDIRTKKLIESIKKSKYYSYFIKQYESPYTIDITFEEIKKKILNQLNPIKEQQIIYLLNDNNVNYFYLLNGWSKIEKTGVWSMGNSSELAIRIDNSLLKKEVKMIIKSSTLNVKDKTTIFINGKELGDFLLHGSNEIIIPKTFTNVKDNLLVIKFQHTNVKSPFELGISQDIRKIKLYLQSLSFVAIHPL